PKDRNHLEKSEILLPDNSGGGRRLAQAACNDSKQLLPGFYHGLTKVTASEACKALSWDFYLERKPRLTQSP
ncbi:MAG: hypothetical protein FWF45_02625, partial [Coriobacteriia bacterium]|nr:hypothetical protein [Coriobacteriia bacterium]